MLVTLYRFIDIVSIVILCLLTQQSTGNKLGLMLGWGRGRKAATQILTLIPLPCFSSHWWICLDFHSFHNRHCTRCNRLLGWEADTVLLAKLRLFHKPYLQLNLGKREVICLYNTISYHYWSYIKNIFPLTHWLRI